MLIQVEYLLYSWLAKCARQILPSAAPGEAEGASELA